MHEEKETEGWKRLMSMPHVAEEIERLKIANLASYYTSEAKYSKTWFSDSSTKIVAALKQQGFWEF
jgi:hypothetical protein